MIVSFSCGASSKQLVCTGESFRPQMVCQMSALPGAQLNSAFHFRSSHFQKRYTSVTLSKSILLSPFGSQAHHGRTLSFSLFKQRGSLYPSAVSQLVNSTECQLTSLSLSSRLRNMSLKLSVPKDERISRIRWNFRPRAWLFGGTSTGVFISFASTKAVSAEADVEEGKDDGSAITSSHGKKVFTDYSITGIPGDGRCLFRSVVHGACLQSGKPIPNESLQRELADELLYLTNIKCPCWGGPLLGVLHDIALPGQTMQVADEFVKRRAETEWFIEGDFDTYVSRIRKPHVWGGEPELLIATHVLQMPITVYMHDENSGGLIAIAEYGQEYGKENPIRILYHGYGHYDALQIPAKRGQKSRL